MAVFCTIYYILSYIETIPQIIKLIKTKSSNDYSLGTKQDLYKLKESDVIELIESSKYKEIFNIWKKAKQIKTSTEKPENVYYVNHGAKVRYIDPLYNGERISHKCKIAKKMIDNNLSYDMNRYVYLDGISM